MKQNIDRDTGQKERGIMICCVTGHRPDGFPFQRIDDNFGFYQYREDLYQEIEGLIHDGYRHFITGMANGADLDFAQGVIFLRDIYQSIVLEAALPYPISVASLALPRNEDKAFVLEQCNLKHTVSTHYFRGCMDKRNRYMVDKSDLVLAIWNGQESGGTWNTIQYARACGKPIRYLMLDHYLDIPLEKAEL